MAAGMADDWKPTLIDVRVVRAIQRWPTPNRASVPAIAADLALSRKTVDASTLRHGRLRRQTCNFLYSGPAVARGFEIRSAILTL